MLDKRGKGKCLKLLGSYTQYKGEAKILIDLGNECTASSRSKEMGGCSSKPQTAECNEGLMDHPPPLNLLFHTPPHGSQHTLKSLFNQHGRDGEDLLGNAQTLHELLLHAVDSKELPDSENQSTGNTEANLQISFPCKQNSSVSVISNAAENNASTCTKIEGSLPDLAEANEEAGAQLESFVSNLQVTEENAEKCSKSEGFTSNSAEGNQEKGAAHLEGFLSGLAEVTEEKGEVMLPALPEENAQDCIGSFLSNLAEENQENAGNLEGSVSYLAEAKLEAECPRLTNFAEENARKLEPQSSPGIVNLELKTEQISESNSSECAECNLGPKSDFLKISEPNFIESLTSDVFQASDAVEDKEAELQGLHGVAVNSEIKREVQGEIAMEATKTPKQDEEAMTYDKNEKSLQGKQTEDHRGKAAMEGAEIEKAMEGKKTELHCEKTLEIEKNEISQEGEKAEVWNEKALEAERLKVQFESGGIPWVQDEDDKLREKMEKAMECEKVGMQDEKGRKTGAQDENSMGEDEKTGVQSERVFNGEVGKMQRDGEDEKAVRVEKLEIMQEAEKRESQDEKNTGVQDEKTRVQGERDEETGVQHEERAEDEKAMANVSSLHVNVEDEEAVADVPSSHVNQSFAFTLEKHSSSFEPLTGSEKSIAIGSGSVLELASKENTVEAAELGLIEKLNESDEKKLAFKDNTINVVADLGLTEKLEADLTKLASDGNTIEAVGLADVEKMEFEQKKTRKTEQIESHKSSIEAVAGGTHATLGNIVKALDDEQSKSTDLEQMLCIEHGRIDHDILGALQHSEADKLDEEKNAKAPGVEESYIEAVIGSSENSNQVVGEKRDASELCTNEEKKAPEALVEQSLHEGNAREESSNLQNPLQLVVENDTSDVNVKVDVSSKAWVFVQKDHDAEKLQCGHIQMPINELHLITSKGVESHTQARNDSALCSTPESSVHENLPCPTVVERDVEKRAADINSSSLSAAEKSFIEGVESKPRQKTSGEAIDDANWKTHMEASKQCDEKGEGLKATKELENLEICN